jgi:phosphoribosylaminoimidazole-succinocarboxamide synthase
LSLTKYFYEKLNQSGFPTHYIDSDIENSTMTVKKAAMFGNGLEIICRYRAVGSFLRRYGMYAKEGQPLDGFIEISLKDDDRNDPPISEDALYMLGILTRDEYKILKNLTGKIAGFVKLELAKKGLELYDIKLEFGRVDEDNHIALIDEISGGNMRVYKDGEYVEPMELGEIMLNK